MRILLNAVILLLLALTAGCFSLANKDEVELFCSYSPNDKHFISASLFGNSNLHGPQWIDVYTNGIHLFKDSIWNEGGIVDEDNYSLVWSEDIAYLTFSGISQNTITYIIDFRSDVISFIQIGPEVERESEFADCAV